MTREEINYWLILRKFSMPKDKIEGAESWPTQSTIAQLMGCSVRRLREYEWRLKKKGLIEVKRLGLGQPNVKYLKDPRL